MAARSCWLSWLATTGVVLRELAESPMLWLGRAETCSVTGTSDLSRVSQSAVRASVSEIKSIPRLLWIPSESAIPGGLMLWTSHR